MRKNKEQNKFELVFTDFNVCRKGYQRKSIHSIYRRNSLSDKNRFMIANRICNDHIRSINDNIKNLNDFLKGMGRKNTNKFSCSEYWFDVMSHGILTKNEIPYKWYKKVSPGDIYNFVSKSNKYFKVD